jgi:hypothetical protein
VWGWKGQVDGGGTQLLRSIGGGRVMRGDVKCNVEWEGRKVVMMIK